MSSSVIDFIKTENKIMQNHEEENLQIYDYI